MSPLPPPRRPVSSNRPDTRPLGRPSPSASTTPTTPIYVALDVEATGVEHRNEIIEVAAVTFTRERIVDRWSTLVHPARPVPLATMQLTGITNEMLKDAPPFSAVAAQVQRFARRYPIVGQSIEIDLKLLAAQGAMLDNPTYDTYELATLLLPDLPVYSLARIAERLEVGTTQEHRALGDCELTAAVFQALLGQIEEFDPETLSEVSRLSDLGQSPFALLFRSVLRERQRSAADGGMGVSILAQMRAQAGGTGEEKGGVDLLYLVPRPRPEPLRDTGSARPLDVPAIRGTFEPGGAFADAFPHYEHRPQQMDMLAAVADAFNTDDTLLVEAGTGTGKSVAYLVPAVAHAMEHGETVVVSTATIALQDQLARKDIPDLQHVLATVGGAAAANGAGLPAEFRATVVKGRANYLCLYRWFKLRQSPTLTPAEARLMLRLLMWLQITDSGDIAEIRFTDDERRAGVPQMWNHVNAGPDSCPNTCIFQKRGQCFVQRARRAAENAHVVIVNHALLLSDMTTNSGVLPPYERLIVDEAHHLEDEATNQLSYSFERITALNYLSLLADARPDGVRGLLGDLPMRVRTAKTPTDVQADVTRICEGLLPRIEEARAFTTILFDRIAAFLSTRPSNEQDSRLRITDAVRHQPAWSDVEFAWADLSVPFSAIATGLTSIYEQVYRLPDDTIQDQDDTLTALTSALRTSTEMRVGAASALAEPDAEMVYWMEQRLPFGGGNASANSESLPGMANTAGIVSVNAAPLHVGATLQADLFGPRRTVILTSATMTTDNTFDYIESRLGIPKSDATAVQVDSPFDYRRAALVYTARDMPEPNRPGYQKGLQDVIAALCEATRGRALVLFTSYSALTATYRAVKPVLEASGIVVLGQRLDGGPRQLIERFKQHPETVLFGTSSFWEGVDVVGDTLSVLIITKLPFKVPSDPVFQARSEGFMDPFGEYAVPQAVLQFRQGFGRLIRSSTDRGVCAILDSRVRSKRYGRTFLNSLPACTMEDGLGVDLPARAAAWLAMAGPEKPKR